MKADAIVYTSKTGFTEEYAKLLGEKTGLPVYSLNKSGLLGKDSKVIYLGWIHASISFTKRGSAPTIKR